ncbi:WxL domain-containing protein [Enterococcus sp. DIV0876]|uniref:WxL domain-containing protein n=1 Tax=Enterococcus sp. DIV0876 TaxID=2774633 RepID=UPI003D2FCFDE
MKKAILSGLLVCGAVLFMVPMVYAADATTEGTITFTENNSNTSPVNPLDPAEDFSGTLTTNTTTGSEGALTLDVIPNIDFGTQEIFASEHTYKAIVASEELESNYLQVTDNRTLSSGKGWTITVSNTQFTSDSSTLTGATLTIPAGEARNNLNTISSDIDTTNFLTYEVALTGTGTAQTIFKTADTADDMTGKGTSTSTWPAANVTLTVPQLTAQEGSYASTITWTLTAGATT